MFFCGGNPSIKQCIHMYTKEKNPILIGIVGGSGSGKTSLIKRIQKEFLQKEVCVISQDEYYLPIEEQQKDENGIENFDLPAAFNWDDLNQDLNKLIQGHIVRRKEYVFNNEIQEPKVLTFHPAPILIIEGLFVFSKSQVFDLLDLKIYVHANNILKIIRRIKRDQMERNYPLDDVLYRYEYHVYPAYEKYILPYKEKADIVINNNDDFEKGFNVISGYLKDYLSTRK